MIGIVCFISCEVTVYKPFTKRWTGGRKLPFNKKIEERCHLHSAKTDALYVTILLSSYYPTNIKKAKFGWMIFVIL